ncbi:MAG: glycosyltransferase family 4 protein [Candidatus Omnitrophica bacterium]|nr:glycosyltransferase family 4 protein [Candidatus Omnitrophota bacterium]
MNILILTNRLTIGGITRYVLDLKSGLKKRGHRVFIACIKGDLELPLKTKSIFSPQILSSYFILKRFIKKEGIQIIHAQVRTTQFLAFLLCKTLKIPYVCTFHGFYRPHFFRKKLPCLGDLTIAVSQAVGRHLINDFNLDKENLRVIYNGIEPHLGSRPDKDYSYLKGKPSLGIIARLAQEKGHIYLFSAFKALLGDYPCARLLVVGKGKKELELKEWVERESLSEKIIFLEEIEHLFSIFNILDISILPSLFEGFGFSLIEAMACGVPVVASAVGGIGEIIKDKETGLLVEPANSEALYKAIKLLLEDNKLRLQIIENAGREIKERFSLEREIREIEKVYYAAIQKYEDLY